MADYSNILNALNPNLSGDLAVFQDLQRRGVSLSDLVRRAEEADRRESEERTRAERELLLVMEQAVKGDPAVKDARRRVSEARAEVLNGICMKDERYREAVSAYEQTIRSAYVESRESRVFH